MSDENQTPPPSKIILPVLRERTVYVKDDGTGKDNSDFVNKSFKGILRLSPNDSSSYIEKSNYINYTEEIKDYISYEDDITGRLDTQFIKVSTSDGNMVDLRLSSFGVEYNNLYVLGATKVVDNSLTLYANHKNALKLGNSSIISDGNALAITGTKPEKEYVEINDNTLDETYVLVNKSAGGNMDFVNAKSLIELFVKSALMELSSVPTGSIHKVPINLTQYKALLAKSKGHNITAENNDPLIRDYLLCDGSFYRVKDFPELAKMLYKERISFWQKTAKFNSEDNKEELQYLTEKVVDPEDEQYNIEDISISGPLFKKLDNSEHTCEEISEEDVRVFRVPDMRGLFIQSVVPTFENVNNPKEVTGTISIDSIKDNRLSIKHGYDSHYHYIVLDNPAHKQSNTYFKSFEEICNEQTPHGYYKLATSTPAALCRYGNIASGATLNVKTSSCGKCCTRCRHSSSYIYYGDSPIYTPVAELGKCKSVGASGGYILSTLNAKLNKGVTRFSWVGSTSWTIDMTLNNSEVFDSITDADLNYTKTPNDIIYSGHEKQYVSYDGKMKELIGYENTPEFYAILPLIKI